MMICWPRSSAIGGARIRPTTSIGPPAGKGTTMVSVRAGQSCAGAGWIDASTSASAAATGVLTMLPSEGLRAFASIRAGAARLDRAGPALDLAGNELREIFRGAVLRRRDGHADRLVALAQRRRLHRLVRRLEIGRASCRERV